MSVFTQKPMDGTRTKFGKYHIVIILQNIKALDKMKFVVSQNKP